MNLYNEIVKATNSVGTIPWSSPVPWDKRDRTGRNGTGREWIASMGRTSYYGAAFITIQPRERERVYIFMIIHVPTRRLSLKGKPIWPRHLGCRGWVPAILGCSPCISLTSVVPPKNSILAKFTCQSLNSCSLCRSARNIRCGEHKIDGTPPTAQTPGPNWLKF